METHRCRGLTQMGVEAEHRLGCLAAHGLEVEPIHMVGSVRAGDSTDLLDVDKLVLVLEAVREVEHRHDLARLGTWREVVV